MWNHLIVLVSAVLTAFCAPLPPKTPDYNPLRDAALLPVLVECNQSAEGTAVRKLCNLYWNVVQNDSASHNVTQEYEAMLALPETNVEGFCGRLLHFPKVMGYVSSMESCKKRCTGLYEDDRVFTTPLCRLILWRLEVQKASQVSPSVGETSALVATPEVVSTAQGVNITSLKPPITPSGGANKVEIPPLVAQKPSTEGLASPKTLEEALKKPAEVSNLPEGPEVKEEAPKVTPEAPKNPSGEVKVVEVKEETPKAVPEAPPSNQSTPEVPKPPEEVKNQKQPDLEEDPNENLKDMEDDDSPDDYEHIEDAAVKGDPENPELGDAGMIFDKSESKDAPAVNKIEVVDAKQDPFQDEAESNFFTYFLCMMVVCVLAYVVYHNKTKVLALVLEGRRSSQGRGRRKHTAAYRKLDSNLEEAITSSAASRTSQIIY